MEIKESMLCSDGKIRYPRTFVRTENKFLNFRKKGSPETSVRIVSSTGKTRSPLQRGSASYPYGTYLGAEILPPGDFEVSLQQFEDAWNNLCEEYYGKKIPFFGKKIRNVKKSLAAYRAVMNAKELKADLVLYLRSHFDLAKQHPRVLTPFYMGSDQGKKLYLKWIKKYATTQDAHNKKCHSDLEILLQEDHKNFLHYKNKASMTPHGIFTIMHRQFTHLYLLSYPDFLELLDRESNGLPPSYVQECRDTLKRLQRNPLDAMNFFKLVEAIKCQVT